MILKYMTNYTRSNFQAHPFHLVSPSPLPIFTCVTPLNIIQSKPNVYNFSKNYNHQFRLFTKKSHLVGEIISPTKVVQSTQKVDICNIRNNVSDKPIETIIPKVVESPEKLDMENISNNVCDSKIIPQTIYNNHYQNRSTFLQDKLFKDNRWIPRDEKTKSNSDSLYKNINPNNSEIDKNEGSMSYSSNMDNTVGTTSDNIDMVSRVIDKLNELTRNLLDNDGLLNGDVDILYYISILLFFLLIFYMLISGILDIIKYLWEKAQIKFLSKGIDMINAIIVAKVIDMTIKTKIALDTFKSLKDIKDCYDWIKYIVDKFNDLRDLKNGYDCIKKTVDKFKRYNRLNTSKILSINTNTREIRDHKVYNDYINNLIKNRINPCVFMNTQNQPPMQPQQSQQVQPNLVNPPAGAPAGGPLAGAPGGVAQQGLQLNIAAPAAGAPANIFNPPAVAPPANTAPALQGWVVHNPTRGVHTPAFLANIAAAQAAPRNVGLSPPRYIRRYLANVNNPSFASLPAVADTNDNGYLYHPHERRVGLHKIGDSGYITYAQRGRYVKVRHVIVNDPNNQMYLPFMTFGTCQPVGSNLADILFSLKKKGIGQVPMAMFSSVPGLHQYLYGALGEVFYPGIPPGVPITKRLIDILRYQS
uniref:Uncharacterized protein n=1 Tax=Pertusaria plittiana TaxID=394545 RepID=A0A2P1M539_9LECA|nr:hypothetical protein [Pertusaria plittiana]